MNKKLLWTLIIVGIVLLATLFWFRFSILLLLNTSVTVLDGSEVDSFPGEMLPTKANSEIIIAADLPIAPYYDDVPGISPPTSGDGTKFALYSGHLNYPKSDNAILIFNYSEIIHEYELPIEIERAKNENTGVLSYYWLKYYWFGDKIFIALNEKETMDPFIYILDSSNGEFKKLEETVPIFGHTFVPGHENEKFAIIRCTSYFFDSCKRSAYYLYDGEHIRKMAELESSEYTRIYGWDNEDFIIAEVEVLESYNSYYEDLDPNNMKIKKVYRLNT